MNFAIIGPSGYIAQRHINAIEKIPNACIQSYLDLHEFNFETLDYQPRCFLDEDIFFDELSSNNCDYLAICSPNHLHASQIIKALKKNVNVICEKPIFFNSNDQLLIEDALSDSSANLHGIMQLRLHPVVARLNKFISDENDLPKIGTLKFITKRDSDYKRSWKVDNSLSGGILFNLGIHYFDLAIQTFGVPKFTEITNKSIFSISGRSIFKNEEFCLNWQISIDDNDLTQGKDTLREFSFGDYQIDFSSVDNDLHYQNYLSILEGDNFSYDNLKSTHEYLSRIISE